MPYLSFSQRMGIKPAEVPIQVDCLSDDTRMDIWNGFYQWFSRCVSDSGYMINLSMMEFMKDYTKHLIDDGYDSVFIDLNGELDHIHVLFELPATVAPAVAVGNLKTQFSKKVREKFSTEFQDVLCGKSFWSDSYFITTTGGASIKALERYIEQQGNPKPKRKYTRRKPTNTHQTKR